MLLSRKGRKIHQGCSTRACLRDLIAAIAAIAAIWVLGVLSLALSLPQGFRSDDSEAENERSHRTESKAGVGHSASPGDFDLKR